MKTNSGYIQKLPFAWLRNNTSVGKGTIAMLGVALLLLSLGATTPAISADSSKAVGVNDGSFESGIDGGFWKEKFNAVGSPVCDNSACGINSFAAPRTGDFWCWFGGVTGQVWKGSVSQKVKMPDSGSAELTFYLWIGHRSGNKKDYLKVTIDGDKVFKAKENKKTYRNGYVQVVVDVSQYADGNKHVLKISGKTTGYDAQNQLDGTNFNVDDVSIS